MVQTILAGGRSKRDEPETLSADTNYPINVCIEQEKIQLTA
jgi:hypothetical protein